MGKRILFVYNPMAGKKNISKSLTAISEMLEAADADITLHATTGARDATETVKRFISEDKCDAILSAGGDGTLDEVMEGVMESGKSMPVAIISVGSTNDFAYSLGIPSDPVAAAEAAVSGREYRCDLSDIDGRYITYVASFGLFSEVSYATDRKLKNRIGYAAYVVSGIKSLKNVRKIHATVKTAGRVVEDDFLLGMLTNSKSVGGFRGITGHGIRFNDGKNELMLVRWPHGPGELLKSLYLVVMHKPDGKLFRRFLVDRAEFEFSEPVVWSLDGERGESTQKSVIRVHKRAVSYLLKKGKVKHR